MATITNQALFNQTKHSGIQIAKVYAALGQAVEEFSELGKQSEDGVTLTTQQTEENLQRYLNETLIWGNESQWTFIDAVTFTTSPATDISGVGVGQAQTESSDTYALEQVVKVRWTIKLQNKDSIEFKLVEREGADIIPVYRFKIHLNDPDGSIDPRASVWVDIRIETIETVAYQLYMTIAGFVVLTSLIAFSPVIELADELLVRCGI